MYLAVATAEFLNSFFFSVLQESGNISRGSGSPQNGWNSTNKLKGKDKFPLG